MNHPRRIAAALSSLAAIVLLLLGLPVALWLLAGSPIPDTLPSLSGLGSSLTSTGLPDSTLISIFGVIGWVAWLHVAASIVIEAAAWMRGRPAPTLAFGGPIQPAVRKLIATAALLVSTSATPAVAFGATSAPRATPVELIVTPTASSAADVGDRAVTAPSDLPTKSYIVARYDTLWGLSEKHLGDPLRWHELFALNQGRPQPHGSALTNAELIRPGWTLRFPNDAIGLEPTAEPETVIPNVARATPPATVPAACPPTVPAVVPVATTTTARPKTPLASTPSTSPAGQPAPATSDASDTDDRATAAWPLVAGGLGAAGLVALLARLRRVQQRRRPIGARPRPPEPEIERFERALRSGADTTVAERLDLALRAFSAGVASSLSDPPHVLAVRTTPSQVELLVAAAPAHPPKGFIVTSNERGWITDPELDMADLRTLAGDAAAPLPSLVNLGDIEDDHILIDLETIGLLTVDGPNASDLINAVGLQLATGTWIDHVDILLVTTESGRDVVGADRIRRYTDFGSALGELRRVAASFDHALAAADASTTFAARFSSHHNDGWIPTVLVSTEDIDDATHDELRVIVGRGGRGVAAIVRAEHRYAWHAHVTEDSLRLTPLGFELSPTLADSTTTAILDRLLCDMAVNDHTECSDATVDAGPVSVAVGPYVDPEFDIEVRMLGAVEIAGVSSPMDRRRSEELITYLATHPKGVNDERLKTVLWREKAPTEGTFNTTVSYARTALGHDESGDPHLRHYSAADRVYRLGPHVTTDLARFEARVEHAKRCNATDAITTLRDALDLVRGAPFEYTRGCEWAHSEGIVSCAEATIADAAHQLAVLYIDGDDYASAIWAAMQGLKGCPGDEALYRDRMLAHHLAGNNAGVDAAFEELCAFVEALEPYDQLHPETLALRERLRRPSRAKRLSGDSGEAS